MRPTEFGLKSPTNKTPFPSTYQVNRTGDLVQLGNSRSGFSFCRSDRFQQYSQDAGISGFRVGPGSYRSNQSNISTARVQSHIYTESNNNAIYDNTGLYYSGNLLVYDKKLVQKPKHLNSLSIRKSTTHRRSVRVSINLGNNNG